MKTIASLIIILFIFTASFYGCGSSKEIDGVEYDTYGLLNANQKENPDIEYDWILGNVIWGVILIETIIAPIYFFGFSLFEPIGKKGNSIKGAKRR